MKRRIKLSLRNRHPRAASCAAVVLVTVTAPMPIVLGQNAAGAFTAAQADRGNKPYADQCASCHGVDFTGSTGTPALRGPEFVAGWDGKTVGSLYDYIRVMMPSGKTGVLSDQEYADVTARILAANGVSAGSIELTKDSPGLNTAIHLSQK